MPKNSSYFIITHAGYPFILLIVLSTLIAYFELDRNLADYLYSAQGHMWALKEHWITESVLHKGGRAVSLLLALTVLGFLVASYFRSSLVPHRRSLVYLITAVAGGSFLISYLKPLLAISCPWEFERYGGHLNYLNLFHQITLRNGEGCFPAAHASAGYAWVALYFFWLNKSVSLRWTGLALAVTAGTLFGFSQQLRGAHFISHDLWALFICWFYSLFTYLIIYRNA